LERKLNYHSRGIVFPLGVSMFYGPTCKTKFPFKVSL
jgi:hypothetical protein